MTSQITHFPVEARKPDAKGFWWPIIGLVVITFLLLLAHQTSLLQLGYPAMAFTIAVYFYVKFPVQFIGYLWWIFFWTPEVRRLSDFVQGGFTEVSLVMTAPLLVSAPLAFTMLRRVRYLGTRPGLPMLLVLIALAYAYVVGIFSAGFAAATFDLSGWLTPLLVGFHLAVSWRRYPEYRLCLTRTFTVGIAACAGYAIIQYVFMPPWDALWLIGSGMTSSMGQPLPFQVRAFGPLNSVGPFATIILAGILGATVSKNNRGRMFAAVFGIIALGLSFVRSAWGALVVAMAYQMVFFDNKTRLRVVVGTLIIVAATIPVFMSSNISDSFQKRINTLTDLQNDTSFSERSNFYQTFLDTALTNVAGVGLGATGLGGKLSDSASSQQYVNFDSGFMQIPFVLGWPGTLLYVFGIGWLMVRGAIAAVRERADKFVIAWFSVAIALISELIFFNQLVAAPGQLALMGMVLPIMAARYSKQQKALQSSQTDIQVRQ